MFRPEKRLPSPGYFAGLGWFGRRKAYGLRISQAATAARVVPGPGFRKPGALMRATMGRRVGTMRPFFVRPTTLSAYTVEVAKPQDLVSQGSWQPSTLPDLGALGVIQRRVRTLQRSPARLRVRGFAKRAKLKTASMFNLVPSEQIPGRYKAELPTYLTQVETIGFVAAPVGTLRKRGLNVHERRGQGAFLRSLLSR